MRSLYWLTAVTLVAAAVTTVAIADYGRRHPQTAAAWWGATAQTRTVPVDQEKTGEPAPYQTSSVGISVPSAGPVPPTNPPPPLDLSVPPSGPVSAPSLNLSVPTTAQNDLPPSPGLPVPPTRPVRIEDVPEHQVLREAALNNLASTKMDVPELPTPTTKAPVVDEFTFNEKPLTPLYVPVQPNAKVVLPPANVIKEVAKLPVIPGVSLSTPVTGQPRNLTSPAENKFLSMPNYRVEPPRGAQVMQGLHAARPAAPEMDNPVMDSMLAFGELIAAMNPTTYLLSMPLDKKAAKTSTNFAITETKATPVTTATVPCDDAKTCPSDAVSITPPTCAAGGACCKNASASDEVVVRTYSISDFTTTSGTNHEDLIRLISTMVAPDTWQTRDSTIEFFAQGKCLVIRHRSSVQEQVGDLLTQLRGQVNKNVRVSAVTPMVRHEPTVTMPFEVQLELVPMTPRECNDRLPRVITNEPGRCVGDDEFFGMIPMRHDGRLMPIPMPLESSSLVPAQFQPRVLEPVLVEEGPVVKNVKPKAPEFFPWFLPYAPLPNGPESCEEELLNRVGFTSYTDDEIAYLFLLACEWEERGKE